MTPGLCWCEGRRSAGIGGFQGGDFTMKSPENSSGGLRMVIYGFKEQVSGSGSGNGWLSGTVINIFNILSYLLRHNILHTRI